MTKEDSIVCPHCGTKMLPWKMNDDGDWGGLIRYVCFNNDCTYYVRGYEHTKKTMNKPASYRHTFFPHNGQSIPLPVWSDNAMREFIVDEEEAE